MTFTISMTCVLTVAIASVAPSVVAIAAEEKIQVAVMDLAALGVDEAVAGALTTEVSNTLQNQRVFRVITREDIKRMVQHEETRQACTGDVAASCMAEIGGALGVAFVIYGDVVKIADVWSVSLVLLDSGRAEAVNRVNKKVNDARALLSVTTDATKLLIQPLLASKTGYLVLESRERDARVTVDGRTVGVTPLPGRLALSMGAHEVQLEKEGFLAWAQTVEVPPAQATVEIVSMVPSQEFMADYETSSSRTRTIAWITAGAAAVLVGAAGALRLIDDARWNDLDAKRFIERRGTCAEINPGYNGTDYCPTALGQQNGVIDSVNSIERSDTIALVAAIGGGVSALVSLFLFSNGDPPGRYDVY